MSQTEPPKIAFVTGGTGFVGSTLIEFLLMDGWKVLALRRASSDMGKLSRLPVQFVEGDVTDIDSLRPHMPERVDAVFHLAASMNLWSRNNELQTRVNVDGTRNMVELALERQAKKFILTSTAASFGSHDKSISEDSLSYGGDSWINYVRTKWLAEEIVREGVRRGLYGLIVCPSAILGPKDTYGWAQLFFQIRENKLKGIPPGIATYNHVHEVAKAHISAVTKGEKGALYLLPGEIAPFAEMIRLMAEVMEVELKAKIVPAVMLKTLAKFGDLVSKFTNKEPELTPEMAALMSLKVIVDSEKAQRTLDYRVIPLRTCIQDSYFWLKDKGYFN